MNIQYDFDNEAESRLYKLVIEKAIKAKTIGRTDEFVVKVTTS